MSKTVSMMACAAWLLAGCSSAATDASTEPSSGSIEATHGSSLTIVTLSPDGKHTTRVVALPDGDELAAQSIVTASCGSTGDAGGGVYDLFWDQPVGTGGAHFFCANGTGTLDLSTLADGTGTWAGKIASYDSQAVSGHFSSTSGAGGLCADFAATATQTNVPLAATSIDFLTLGSVCPPQSCPVGQFHCAITCTNPARSSYECFSDSICSGNKSLYDEYCLYEQNIQCGIHDIVPNPCQKK